MAALDWLLLTRPAATGHPTPPPPGVPPMPGQIQDWVRESTTSISTGDLTLNGAVTGYRSFSAAGFTNLEAVAYSVFTVDAAGNPDGTAFEIGVGQYATGASRLTGRTPVASSNAGALVNFAAGTKHVIIAPLTDMTVRAGAINNCRLSLDTNWCPTADIASSSTLRLLPGPAGGQIGIPFLGNTDLFVVGNVGAGVSLTLPTATLVSSRTCGTTNGSTAVTHSSATAWPVGMLVTGTGISTGTYVMASTTTTVTLSRPSTATNASVTLSCYQSIFDVYAYASGARNATTGMPTVLIYASPWTNNSTPPTKDSFTTGVPVCMNSAIGGERYIGTIQYITTTTSCDTAKQRFLYNQYNHLHRRLHTTDAGSDYNYTTATWRIAHADYNNQVEWVAGAVAAMTGHGLLLNGQQAFDSSTGATLYGGIGVDTDASPTGNSKRGTGTGTVYGMTPLSSFYTDWPGIGYHRAMLMEFGGGSATQRTGGNGGNTLSGIIMG